jgi:hypothetical protein
VLNQANGEAQPQRDDAALPAAEPVNAPKKKAGGRGPPAKGEKREGNRGGRKAAAQGDQAKKKRPGKKERAKAKELEADSEEEEEPVPANIHELGYKLSQQNREAVAAEAKVRAIDGALPQNMPVVNHQFFESRWVVHSWMFIIWVMLLFLSVRASLCPKPPVFSWYPGRALTFACYELSRLACHHFSRVYRFVLAGELPCVEYYAERAANQEYFDFWWSDYGYANVLLHVMFYYMVLVSLKECVYWTYFKYVYLSGSTERVMQRLSSVSGVDSELLATMSKAVTFVGCGAKALADLKHRGLGWIEQHRAHWTAAVAQDQVVSALALVMTMDLEGKAWAWWNWTGLGAWWARWTWAREGRSPLGDLAPSN